MAAEVQQRKSRRGQREEVKGKKGLSGIEGKLSESDEKRIHDMKYFKKGLSHPLAFFALSFPSSSLTHSQIQPSVLIPFKVG